MVIYSVCDPAFKAYGKVLEGYDTEELVEAMKAIPLPEEGTAYRPGIESLEACAVFEEPKTRKKLQKGNKRTMFSLKVLVKWWLRQRRKHQLPNFALGGASGEYIECKHKSDYMAVNSKTVAKMMKGGKYYLSKDGFLSYNGQMTKFFRLCLMMSKSILRRIPGTESDYDCLVFPKPAKMMVQAEGEYHKFADVEIVEISKAEKPLLAIVK